MLAHITQERHTHTATADSWKQCASQKEKNYGQMMMHVLQFSRTQTRDGSLVTKTRRTHVGLLLAHKCVRQAEMTELQKYILNSVDKSHMKYSANREANIVATLRVRGTNTMLLCDWFDDESSWERMHATLFVLKRLFPIQFDIF